MKLSLKNTRLELSSLGLWPFMMMTMMISTSRFVSFADASVAGLDIVDSSEPPQQYLIRYSDPSVLDEIIGMNGFSLVRNIPALKTASISVTSEINFGILQALPLIESIDPDYELKAFETTATTTTKLRGSNSNDGVGDEIEGTTKSTSKASSQRRNLAETVPYGISMVQADQLDLPTPLTDDEKIKVCVVDTGYNLGHEDLPNDIENPDHDVVGYSAYPAQFWFIDLNNHGTHVAGTIGAIGGNNIGVDSILSDPTKFKFLIGKGLTDAGTGLTSAVLEAVQACADAGAKVINLSLGGGSFSATEASAYRDVFDQGVLLVAAAGNDGNSALGYPASYSHLISVAAVDANENRASFSQFNNQVELAAPGVGVYSTVPPFTGYDFYDGTSMASPHVAGVAALVWAHFPECTNLQIRNVLFKTAKDKGQVGCDSRYGAGIVQAKAAYDLLKAEGCSAGGTTPTRPSNGNFGGCAQV